MDLMKSSGRRRGRSVALLLAGILAGTVLIQPAVAHFRPRIGHLIRHVFNRADPRYYNEGQTVDNANNLDGLDSTAFMEVVAYAHVLSGGGVVEAESKGISDSNVTRESTSAYCFRNIPQFKFALATPHYDGGADEDVTAAIAFPGTGFTTDCSATVQAEIATIVESTYAPHEFYVAFYS
jgi:hypothetical protein